MKKVLIAIAGICIWKVFTIAASTVVIGLEKLMTMAGVQ